MLTFINFAHAKRRLVAILALACLSPGHDELLNKQDDIWSRDEHAETKHEHPHSAERRRNENARSYILRTLQNGPKMLFGIFFFLFMFICHIYVVGGTFCSILNLQVSILESLLINPENKSWSFLFIENPARFGLDSWRISVLIRHSRIFPGLHSSQIALCARGKPWHSCPTECCLFVVHSNPCKFVHLYRLVFV